MMKKKKGKRLKNVKGEIQLPEEVIQHIQSFMSGKEAAQTTILSKSWYSAWLTRPTIDFDERDFGNRILPFEEFAKKTIQRYEASSLKIQSFSLRMITSQKWALDLFLSAIKKMGATHLKLYWPQKSFLLMTELLGTQTLVELSLNGFIFDESCVVGNSTLKSLTLERVMITSDGVLKDLTSRCISMEELSLSDCIGFELSPSNMYELHKLRRLFLYNVSVDSMFFTDFGSRFPCLKDLTIHECHYWTTIHIASTSLHTVSFKRRLTSRSHRAKFDVPNIRKFTYSASRLPSHDLSINGASSWEWELDINIACNSFPKTSWLMNLKKVLNKFARSRISLFMDVHVSKRRMTESEHEVDIEVVPNPLVVENLMIHAPPAFCCAFLVRSLGVFRPKFVTHRDWTKCPSMLDEVKSVRERLVQALYVSNWQEKFGQFGLKKVNVEIYKEFDTEWRPLQLRKHVADPNANVRFHLIWED